MNNVLIIGETGVGKSSVINLITGVNVAKSSSGTTRGTFSMDKHQYEKYTLIDTVGYNDTTEKNLTESMTNLARFAMEIKDEGVSLIIYVMKKGRINAASVKNYDFFVKSFCKSNVPVLLIVTHCENESSKNNWFTSEQETFEKNGMNFAGTVCGCSLDLDDPNLDEDMLPILKAKRNRTQQQIRSMILELALVTPWKPFDWKEWIVTVFFALVALGLSVIQILASVTMMGGGLGPIIGPLILAAASRFWKPPAPGGI